MVKVYVNDAVSQLKRNFKNLDADAVAKASYNAINRTLTKGRTDARREVKNVYNIPQKNLGGIAKKDATRRLLIGYIIASTKPIPMDAFNPKFQTVSSSIVITKRGAKNVKQFGRRKKNAAKGVSVEVVKGRRQIVPYAFMLPNGKARVFARGAYKQGGSWGFITRNKRVSKDGNDTPIKPLVSVTVHGAIINKTVEAKLAASISAYYPQRLQAELNYQLQKMKSQ